MRRTFSKPTVIWTLIAASMIAMTACATPQQPESLAQKAARIHDDAIVIDTEIDIRFDMYTAPGKDPAIDGDWQFTLPKMERGGMDGAVFVVYVGQEMPTPEGYDKAYAGARKKLAAIQRMAADNPESMEIAKTADDVERIEAAGKRAAMIGIVNASVLGPNMENLDAYDAAGVVYMAFTHVGHNQFSDSARPSAPNGDKPERYGGLSPLGLDLIAEMNQRGILIDVSQISPKALLQAAQASKAPIIASHSAIHALVPTARNVTDEGLKAIKSTGGVIQVVAFRTFILDTYDELQAGIEEVRQSFGLTPGMTTDHMSKEEFQVFIKAYGTVIKSMPLPTVAQYVDHIDYAVTLLGIDHVGISSDFEHGGGVDGWNDVSETGNVTLELVRRGYSQEDVTKILGGNFLRVMRAAEEVTAQLAGE